MERNDQLEPLSVPLTVADTGMFEGPSVPPMPARGRMVDHRHRSLQGYMAGSRPSTGFPEIKTSIKERLQRFVGKWRSSASQGMMMRDQQAIVDRSLASIDASLETLKNRTQTLAGKFSTLYTAMGHERVERARTVLNDCLKDITQLSTQAHLDLKSVRELMNIVTIRIASHMKYRSLLNKLTACTNQARRISEHWEQRFADRFRSTARIMHPEISDMRIEELLRSHPASSLVYREDASLQEQNDARQLEDLREMHASVTQLTSLFIDTSLLIRQQDDQIEVISEQVSQGVADLSEGNISMQEAIEFKRASRRKTVIIALALTGIAVAIGIIIWLAVKK